MLSGCLTTELRHYLVWSTFIIALLIVSNGRAEMPPLYAQGCNDCHGMPPLDSPYRNISTGSFKGNHQTHASSQRTSCSRCHSSSSSFSYGHMEGSITLTDNLNGSAVPARYKIGGIGVSFVNRTSNPTLGVCSNVNCHFESDTPSWGSIQYSSTGDCSACHSVPGPSSPHAKHELYYSWAGNGCTRCHPDYVAGLRFNHATSAASRGIRVMLAEGSYSGTGAGWLPSQSATRVLGSCSGVYCHSNGQDPAAYISQTWSGTLGCGGCHGDAAADTLSGAHRQHVNNAAVLGANFGCAECHGFTVSSGTTINDRSRHVNRLIDYSGAKGGRNAACANFYCHSDGNGTYVNPPGWKSGATLDCSGCHGGSAESAAPIISGKHGRHMNNYSTLGRDNNLSCSECHASTVSGAGVLASGGKHLDALKNYSGSRAGSIAVAGSGKCSTVYCHSTGMQVNQFWNMTAADWYSSRALSCSGCHGTATLPDGTFAGFTSVVGEPNYANGGAASSTANSHGKHVGGAGVADSTGCARCHASTVDASVPGKFRDYSTSHLSANRNVSFSPAVQGRYSAASQQCLTVYCHSNGLPFDNSTTVYFTPRWGETTTCSSCHSDPSQADRLSGRHGKHTASTIYVSSCDRCHAGTVGADGKILDKTRHANKNKDITFRDGGSYNQSTKDCSTYCHSDARSGAPAFGVKWSDTDVTMKCYSCHKGTKADSTAANCDTLFGAWSSVKGYCTPELTMASNAHHRLVGPQWVRKYPCTYCHTATIEAVPDGQRVTDGALLPEKHVNGLTDVKIATKWEIGSRPEKPSYDPITKVCDNVYCHSDGTTEPEVVRPIAWNGQKTECNSCHGHPTGSCSNAGCHDGLVHPDDPTGKLWTLPAKYGNQSSYHWPVGQEWMGSLPMFPNQGPLSARPNSHARHAETNFTCDQCHAKTVLNGECTTCHKDGVPTGGMGEVAHIDANFHVNKTKDVDFRNAEASYDPSTRICTNTLCHPAGANPVWGSSVNSVTCLSCHGIASPDVDDYDAFNGTQGKINKTEWERTGHGRGIYGAFTSAYPVSKNPAANFPGNPCWYCHDNGVIHKDANNPYRLKMHVQYERRFEKECVFCHMEGTNAECLACHVGQTDSLSPQATTGGILFKFRNGSTVTRHTDHTYVANCITGASCHDSDANTHDVNAGVWTAEMKQDVKSQYMMMGVCLQCHDDDSSNQCTNCHIAPESNPLKYSLGYDPGTGFIKPTKARASAGHFGYKHYRSFKKSGGWTKNAYGNFSGNWRGGKFCWDCHDPHGDSNIFMIQKKIATETDGRFGIPVQGKQAEVVFLGVAGQDYVKKTGTIDGICNVCHSPDSKHYTSNYGDSHNYTRRCTTCHEHRFADSHASKQSCNTEGCHETTRPIPKHTAFGLPRDCTKCHSGTVGQRMDVMGQMKSNSHHVQGVEVTNKHCYECHWEATPSGLIDNQYHTGYNYKTYTSVKNDVVDLVLYGNKERPAVYRDISSAAGRATAIRFLASNMGTLQERNEVGKVSSHCLSCHNDENNDMQPFNDCKTPRQYAWDLQSIAARYSQTGTTTWGKYVGTAGAAPRNITKAFSAHGKGVSNAGGWGSAAGTGLDGAITDTRGGAGNRNVECFDCHNSHGSKVVGTTTSYATFNGTNNGGNLKETKQNIGGYANDYKASANSSGINPYGAGAGQCFDCHNSATTGEVVPNGKTPWGYNSTFGATAPIMGYRDTMRFGQGTKAFIARYPFRDTKKTIVGGHMKASEPAGSLPNLAKDTGTAGSGSTTSLTDNGKNWTGPNKWRNFYLLMTSGNNNGQLRKITASTTTSLTVEAFGAAVASGDTYKIVPYSMTVNGLCTPCHDPHGVSPTLGSNQAYSVPLLKGSWLASPYKDDNPQPVTSNGSRPAPLWRIDRNTFSASINNNVRIRENESQFAGLCLNCHKKESLVDGSNRNTAVKSIDRIHESVKGWGVNNEHSFPCSKCHQPHNSGLPRLMQTNCFDYKHRGNAASGGSWGRSNWRGGNWWGFPRGAYNTLRCHNDNREDGTSKRWGHLPEYPNNYFWNSVTTWP